MPAKGYRVTERAGCCADWMEHVIDTNGDPYLKTPDDELSFIVRHSLDVYGFIIVCLYLVFLISNKLLRLLAGEAARRSGVPRKDGAGDPRHYVAKVKSI